MFTVYVINLTYLDYLLLYYLTYQYSDTSANE